jgi:hypothetical protein
MGDGRVRDGGERELRGGIGEEDRAGDDGQCDARQEMGRHIEPAPPSKLFRRPRHRQPNRRRREREEMWEKAGPVAPWRRH